MPQLFSLFPDLTVGENVDFVASLFGLLLWRRRRRFEAVLELVDLWAVRGRQASQLSGGMQRRLELACAMVHEPAVLFLDEPTAGLDPLLRNVIWTELHRLREAGRTILVTTQYVGEAEECADRGPVLGRPAGVAGHPDEMRRAAMGGDVLEVQTAGLFDGERLAGLPIVRSVRQQSARELLVTTDDAGTALAAGPRGDRGGRRDRHIEPRVPAHVRRRLRDPGQPITGRLRRPPCAGTAAAMIVFQVLTRILAYVGKELVEVDPPAGRPGEPGPRPVPDHGRLRARIRQLGQSLSRRAGRAARRRDSRRTSPPTAVRAPRGPLDRRRNGRCRGRAGPA